MILPVLVVAVIGVMALAAMFAVALGHAGARADLESERLLAQRQAPYSVAKTPSAPAPGWHGSER